MNAPAKTLCTLLLLPAALTGCIDESELDDALMFDESELSDPEAPPLSPTLDVDAQAPADPSNHSIQCGPVGYWYQSPAPTPWYDLANCYVAPLPQGVEAFVWSNNWYVRPGPGNSCAIGWFDLANCYIGSAPAGTQAFIYANNMYFTPTPVEAIPNSRPNCVSPWGPGPMQNCIQEAEAEALDYATSPTGSSDYNWMWGDPCPQGTSVVDGSQFYVPGSCMIDNASPVCGPEYRYARYKIGALCL